MRRMRRVWSLSCVAVVFWVSAAGHAAASEQSRAEQSFSSFCKQWVDALNSYARSHIACTRQPDGRFVAEYTACGDDLDVQVKPADSGSSFVGMLRYREKKYQSSAQNREAALQGPLTVAAEANVTQLFLYRNGRWQY